MADKLTHAQAQAASFWDGRTLVSAAAGSGKTKVLVERLMRYLTDPAQNANIDDFLIITYTKAAAAELRGKIAHRLTELIADDPQNRHLQRQLQRLCLAQISTVHSFCSAILREYAYRLELPADFRAADEDECRELREQAMERALDAAYARISQDADLRAFTDTQGIGRNDSRLPPLLFKVYDSARCHIDPDAWLDACVQELSVENVTDAGETAWGRYLLDDLRAFLAEQIGALSDCAALAGSVTGWEKAAALLWENVDSLRALQNARTWDEVAAQRTLSFGTLRFSKKGSDEEKQTRIKAARDACKAALKKKLEPFLPSRQILAEMTQTGAAARGMGELVRAFAAEYARGKARRRVVDFSDQEQNALTLLLGQPRGLPTAAAREIGRRYREVLVDEYQDSNAVQDAIFTALTGERKNLFLVGDVKQSIYQFRLADPGIFLEKYDRFVPADCAMPGMDRKVLLSSNFRSGEGILTAVNRVFSTCMSRSVGGLDYGEAEALQAGIPHVPLEEPEVTLRLLTVREDSYAEEAADTAAEIARLLDGTHFVRQGDGLRPIKAEDIVILLRSPGSVGAEYQSALRERGIPCVLGGGTDLLQAEEIQTLYALLRIVGNPRQDIPLVSVLASPLFGFTADALAAIYAQNHGADWYETICACDDPKAVQFLQVLSFLRETARMEPLSGLLQAITAVTRLDSLYAAMPGGQMRLANLQAFYQLASEFEQSGRRDLDAFLEHLEALAESGGISSSTESGGAVRIMSIHKSKGLEFPVVFLCGLARSFNTENLRAQVLCDKELGIGLSWVDAQAWIRRPTLSRRAIAEKSEKESVSEELRVLYVAMTRARDRLIMSYATQSPQQDLDALSARIGIGSMPALAAEALCPGDWILLTEAAGNAAWETVCCEAPQRTAAVTRDTQAAATMPQRTEALLRAGLAFRYPHEAATHAPSKQTATQRKGREKDQEAAEFAAEEARQPERHWRKPAFVRAEADARAYGIAMHAAMQYLQYGRCADEAGVRAEIARLCAAGSLLPEQGEQINCGQIAAFFQTPIGKRLRAGESVLREFKFSILTDGGETDPALAGERVLLQGVVDCALLEADGITIVDFKTDRVTEETLLPTAERYRDQVAAYANALSRIYERPVKETLLYFFRLNCFVPM